MTLIDNAIDSLEFSKIKLYLSSFYNIILLFEKFEVEGNNLNIDSNEFLDQAQDIFNNYDSLSTTILEKTENKLDLTLVFVLYVYYLSSNVLTNIKNIEFIKWWKNKITIQVFLRYRRLQNNDNFTITSDGAYNFFYTFSSTLKTSYFYLAKTDFFFI